MPKRRNAHAVAAWSRHAGAHNPGTHKPDYDDTDEQLEEYYGEQEGQESLRDGEGSSGSSGSHE